jgi:hypothetical protein
MRTIDSNIKISRVKNGWIVNLPFSEPISFEYPGMSLPEIEMGKLMAREMSKEFNKDPLLASLEMENEKMPELPNNEIGIQENIFVFQTFKEVLNFLQGKYE